MSNGPQWWVNVWIKHTVTSGVGVAATRREKAAMIEVKAVNRMFAMLTLSLLHASFYLFFPFTQCHIERLNLRTLDKKFRCRSVPNTGVMSMMCEYYMSTHVSSGTWRLSIGEDPSLDSLIENHWMLVNPSRSPSRASCHTQCGCVFFGWKKNGSAVFAHSKCTSNNKIGFNGLVSYSAVLLPNFYSVPIWTSYESESTFVADHTRVS